MKIAINKCYGGFSLSAKAVKRLAELNNKECYFFVWDISNNDGEVEYLPISLEEAQKTSLFYAFTIPNPNEYLKKDKRWSEMTAKEKNFYNKKFDKIDLESRPKDRTDPKLIQTIEELGDEASGKLADIKVVEIPDDVEWEIVEYDGLETVHEKHRSW